MAHIVQVLCVPHDPGGVAQRSGDVPEPYRDALAAFEELRVELASTEPDVLLAVTGDHVGRWFAADTATCLIGNEAGAAAGHAFDPDMGDIRPHGGRIGDLLGRHLVRRGSRAGIEFAYSDGILAEHGVTVALSLLRPEEDLPVVRLCTNVTAPSSATARRVRQQGGIVRRLLDDYPDECRVAVITIGPALGHGVPGCPEYGFALGVVGGRAPDWSWLIDAPAAPAMGFARWDGPTP